MRRDTEIGTKGEVHVMTEAEVGVKKTKKQQGFLAKTRS